MDVAETVRREEPVVEAPRHRRGDGHHEDDGTRHADGRVELLRHAEERTATEKAAENEVVHQHRADEYHQVVAHNLAELYHFSEPPSRRARTTSRF